jgi:hypothetical protein
VGLCVGITPGQRFMTCMSRSTLRLDGPAGYESSSNRAASSCSCVANRPSKLLRLWTTEPNLIGLTCRCTSLAIRWAGGDSEKRRISMVVRL